MWAPWQNAAVLLCALTATQGQEYQLVGLWGAENGRASDDTGITNIGAPTGTVQTYSRPTVAIGGGATDFAEFLNVALAGRAFVTQNPLSWNLSLMVWAGTSATLTVKEHGVAQEATHTISDSDTVQVAGGTSGILEITSTVDVVVAWVVAWHYAQLLPPRQAIYGQCTGSCTVSIWGGDTSLPIERICTDGSIEQVQAGTYTGSLDYNGVSCKWTAPTGYEISGMNFRNFSGHSHDHASSFVPAEYFQLTTPVPTYFPVLLLISEGPATCLYASNTVTLTGAPGVYHARLIGVAEATVFECDMPVTAMGEGHCPSTGGWMSCEKKETSLIAAPMPSTTTTSSTTTVTSMTTSTTTLSVTTSTATQSATTASTSTTATTPTTTTPTTATSTPTSTTTTASMSTSTTTSSDTSTASTTTNSDTSTASTTTNSDTSTASTTTTSDTSTASTTTTNDLTATALVDRVEALETALLTTLLADNVTTVTQRVDGFTLVAARFDAAAVAAVGGSLTVPLEASDAAVTVPSSLFPSLGLGAEAVVLTVAMVDLATVKFITGNENESEAQVVASINVNLLSFTGRRFNVSGLADPIKLVMPTNDSAGVECAFWDESSATWATKGVELGELGEGTVECKATHLTLFAAIVRGFVKTLACSQVSLLNVESVMELGKGDWYWTLGAVVHWTLLVTFALLLSLATCLDLRRWKQVGSSDMHLLIPLRDNVPEVQEAGQEQERRGLCACVVGCVLGCRTSLLECCQSSSALRDVVDEIFSQWFDHFGELRDLVEGMVCGLELGAPTAGRIVALVHRLLAKTLVLSARRQVTVSLGVSWDTSALVIEEAELTEVAQAHRAREPNGVPGGVSRITLAREEAWGQLHRDLEVKLDVAMLASAHWSSLPGTIWSLFLHQNPISTCLVRCALTSCKMRVLLFMVDVTGSILLATVFFSANGIPRKRSRHLGCDTEDSTLEFVGRILAVGTGSILAAGIPTMILGSLCTRGPKKFEYEGCPQWNKQLKIWRIQDTAIWILGSLYVAFCIFFICLFLANVDAEDHGEWLLSSLISVVESTVVIPLAMAMLLPLLVMACLHTISFHRRLTKEELVGELHLQFKNDMNMAVAVGNI